LFNVIGGKDLSMAEISAAAEIIKDRVSPDATFIFGASIDPSYEDMEITVIATGFEADYNTSSDFLGNNKSMGAPAQQLEDLMNRRPLTQSNPQPQPQQQKQGIFGSFGRTATTQDEEDLDSLPSFLRRKPRNEDSVLNAEDENDNVDQE
jgi:cell division GTPase FtsZ